MKQPLLLTGADLRLEQVYAVAYQPDAFDVQLAPDAMTRIESSRRVVDMIVSSQKTVYGINTGFGALSEVKIPPTELEQLQLNLLRSHAVGTGPVLEAPVVRAMILLRANTFAKGVSGIRLELVQALVDMLNKNILPVVPSQGSLGASGDLAPLAHLALVLIGEGEATVNGTRMSGKTAMAKAGLPIFSLKAKEGLALVNGTQMMTAIGALSLIEAERVMENAELAAAMTVEAMRASHKPFDNRVGQMRPHPGALQSAEAMRKLLYDSDVMEAHRHCSKVQDAYSLRCITQVHGAIREVLDQVRRTLSIEINSATDNPLVFPSGMVLSQGNFHGEPVAMMLDMLAIAMAELASISERRISKLMNPVFSDLPAFLAAGKQGLNSGLMIAHYTAASLVSENKVLSHPACVDSIPTSNDKEDHVSMGATAARKAEKVVNHARWVVAAELLAASQGLGLQGLDGDQPDKQPVKPGKGVYAAYQIIRQHVKPLADDRNMVPDIERLMALIQDESLLDAANSSEVLTSSAVASSVIASSEHLSAEIANSNGANQKAGKKDDASMFVQAQGKPDDGP